MRKIVNLLLCVTLVSLGSGFPGNFGDDMWYGNRNENERFDSQLYWNNYYNDDFEGCGIREKEFGSDTFNFLHTLAANYPENPSPKVQARMMDMMRIFADFYPHPHNYFRRSMMHIQPDTSNRESFSQFMCVLHNDLNRQKGKPEFDCSRVIDFWANDCSQTFEYDCEPGRKDVGSATWNMMHTYAFTYPESPSPRQQEDMRRFMYLLAEFYPSLNYYYYYQYVSSINEPDTSNRENFMNWMCMAHNYVNARKGKPEFDCDEVWNRWQYNGCESD